MLKIELSTKIFLLIIIIMAIYENDLQLKYKNMLGLKFVENTSDINKPLSLAARNALNGKLGLTGGTLTGGLTGTTGIFSNDVISNTSTSGYTGGISMLWLHTQLTSLQTQISLLSSFTTITPNSLFPVKIPFSYTTIDQISNSSGSTYSTKSPYYVCIGAYRPIAMTSINSNYGFFGAWGINKNTVNRGIWTGNWTFITKLWFDSSPTTEPSPNICDRIVVKFGEKWDRWDYGSEGVNNRGDQGTTGSDSTNPSENIYLMINNINNTTSPFPTVTPSNMAISINNPTAIAPFWSQFPERSVSNFQGGVYIIISYNTSAVTINFCVSNIATTNVITYISATTDINPLTNDRRPFHIYVNGGIPYWFFGMVLFKTSDDTLPNYIAEYKRQFKIIY